MVAGFLATAILMPFAAAHLSVTWALAAWIVYGVALVLADRATDDRATSIRWSDWGVALVAARGATRWRLVSVGTDTVRVAREGRELEAHAVLEDPRSSGGPGADLGRVSADVLCRSPIDETAYRASAPLVFPDALRARRTVIVATIGMLLALPMMAPALAVRLMPGTELLRR